MIEKWIIGKEEPTEKKLFLWNMIGSGIYAAASMILTYLTIRMIGAEDGGIFSIGLTLAQMFIYIAYYEMRNFEVTDAENKYQFSDYYTVKIINCIIMMIVSAIYIVLKQYSAYKAVVVFLVCIYRMLDGYADVFEAQFHKDGRLDLAGKSMAFRTIISVLIYFIILGITQNLIGALIGAIISGVIGIYLFNIATFKKFGSISIQWNKDKIVGILKDCFPLFLGMFLWTYLLSASRMAVDDKMTSEFQSYYQVLFMPVSVINLFAGFLLRPSLIELTNCWANQKRKAFWKIIGKMILELAVFTVICMGAAYLCGVQVLSIIVGCDLQEYRGVLTFLIFAGGFNAIAYTLYYVLTIYRSQKSIMLGYGIASVVAFCISGVLVEKYALMGAAISYFLPNVVLMIIFVICIVIKETFVKTGKEYK